MTQRQSRDELPRGSFPRSDNIKSERGKERRRRTDGDLVPISTKISVEARNRDARWPRSTAKKIEKACERATRTSENIRPSSANELEPARDRGLLALFPFLPFFLSSRPPDADAPPRESSASLRPCNRARRRCSLYHNNLYFRRGGSAAALLRAAADVPLVLSPS